MEDLKFDPNEFLKNVYYREMPNSCIYGHSKSFKIAFYDDNTIDPVKYWLHRPRNEVHDDCDVLKIRMFWAMLFEKNAVAAEGWMMNSGFDLTNIAVIEFLEDFMDLFKSVADIPCFVRGIMSMEHKISDKTFNLDHVLEWVKATDNTEVVPQLLFFGDNILPILEEVVNHYSFSLNRMASNLCSLKNEEEQGECALCIKKSESSKTKGNKEFSKENYESAVKLYTKAIQYQPENHILYGNRALCYLRIAEYTLALADGKRAIILKQTWYKGHYRFCDALFLVGDYQRALAANEKAQILCKMDPDGVKELSQQNLKFRKVIENKPGLGELDARYLPFPFASSKEPGVSCPMYVTRLRIERDKITPVSTGSTKKTEIKKKTNATASYVHCKLCKKHLHRGTRKQYSYGTSSMWKHIKSMHKVRFLRMLREKASRQTSAPSTSGEGQSSENIAIPAKCTEIKCMALHCTKCQQLVIKDTDNVITMLDKAKSHRC